MHPWPPAWMRAQWWRYPPPYYPMKPSEELKALEELKKDLEAELADITKRIEDLKESMQEGK
ncbi:MAG: DUF5320 domain-containing protein [Candidatus Bathyarchaeia archaeon]